VGRAVAVVLDAEATSFLMMGALSPGGYLGTCVSTMADRETAAEMPCEAGAYKPFSARTGFGGLVQG
jgi:hypothetical protein